VVKFENEVDPGLKSSNGTGGSHKARCPPDSTKPGPDAKRNEPQSRRDPTKEQPAWRSRRLGGSIELILFVHIVPFCGYPMLRPRKGTKGAKGRFGCGGSGGSMGHYRTSESLFGSDRVIDLALRQVFLQLFRALLGDTRVLEVQLLERLETGKRLESGVGDLGIREIQH
jgi:hypothetical protein